MKPLNPQDMNTFLGIQPTNGANTTSLTPNQSATALGSSTNGLMGALSGAWQSYAQTAGGIATGVAKGELSTLQNIGGVIAKPLGAALGVPQEQIGIPSQVLSPKGMTEQVGYTGEKIGEFAVPGGLEKSAVAKGASYLDKIPQLIGATGKTATAITGALKTALQSAVSGLSFGGVTAAQTGDLQQAKGAAELGGVLGVAGKALETFGPSISHALNKADFRLSPSQEAKTAKIADSAAGFITKNKILGNDTTKFGKLTMINRNLESALQSSLPKDVAVPKNEIVDEINKNVEALRATDPAIYNQARSKADEAINLLQAQKGDAAFTKGGTISVQDALAGKRSWASMAFKLSKKGKADPTVASEGAYAVEQAYQKGLENTLQRTDTSIKIPTQLSKYFDGATEVTLPDFNKVYSQAINAKNLTGIAQYKNDAGLFGRLFGLWVGKTMGQAVVPGLMGEIVGAGIGEAASTHIPGVARNVLERTLSAPPSAVTGTGKVYQATQNQPDMGQ